MRQLAGAWVQLASESRLPALPRSLPSPPALGKRTSTPGCYPSIPIAIVAAEQPVHTRWGAGQVVRGADGRQGVAAATAARRLLLCGEVHGQARPGAVAPLHCSWRRRPQIIYFNRPPCYATHTHCATSECISLELVKHIVKCQ